MRAFTAALLALSVSATALSGCGQSVSPVAAQAQAGQAQAQGRHAAPASQLAREFAEQLSAKYGDKLTHKGTTVTLSADKTSRTIYEFARTPATGKVRVSSGEYTFEIAHAKLLEGGKSGEMNAEVLPAMLVPIAIQVGLGAAVSVANYWIHHRGENFKRDEAIKAAVEGMLAAMIPITRDLKYARFLAPLALALVKSAASLNYKDLAKAAMDNLDDIVKTLIAIIHDMKSSANDEAPVAAAL
jgi:hypothetical protein